MYRQGRVGRVQGGRVVQGGPGEDPEVVQNVDESGPKAGKGGPELSGHLRGIWQKAVKSGSKSDNLRNDPE